MMYQLELDLSQVQVDQNVGITTRSKVQGTSNLSVQGFLFPLHDLIPLSGQRRLDDKVLQLGISELQYVSQFIDEF